MASEASSAIATILIVEDEFAIRDMAAENLREAGYAVLEAATGEAALALLEKNDSISLVFTDIRLGGRLNGWDVAEAFRAKHPKLHVIYTSGYMTMPPRIVKDGLFVTKPYDMADVIDACRALCTHRA